MLKKHFNFFDIQNMKFDIVVYERRFISKTYGFSVASI